MIKDEAIKELTELLPEEFLSEYTEALDMAIKALEKDQCGDCIDRKIVMECFVKARKTTPFCDEQWKITKGLIEQLPPVSPKPKIGRWARELIRNEYGGCIGAKMICSECGQDNGYDKRMKFCPNCGCKMQEVEEC